MTDEQAQQLVEDLSLQYFNRPFLHNAYFNNRLKSTGGRYLLRSHNIELNKKLYDYFGIDELRGIILHELCHYHLHIQGLGYKHRDKDFRMLLLEVGAPRFCSTIEETPLKRRPKTIHFYGCARCQQLYKRKRKMDVTKYRCSKCAGEIRLIMSENNGLNN
ncbi:SprT family protein [Solibacillus sp. FSL H8-0538]|uniref:SprT family protein n=1 Tax=Solibacillus sp. FSL H8-0538 TaxID=2921400 RepID=UPI0030F8C45D